MSLKEKALKIHRALFRNISCDTTEEVLDDIKKELKQPAFGGFGAGEIQRYLKTTEDVLQKLENKGTIKIGDYEKLRELAETLKLQPILDFVAQAEKSLVEIGWPVKLPQLDAPRGEPRHEPMDTQDPYQQGGIAPSQMAQPTNPHGSLQDDRMRAPKRPASVALIPSTVAKRQKTGETTETPRDDTPSTRLNSRSGQYKDSVPDNDPSDCPTEYEPGRGYVLFINNFFPKKEDQQRKGAEADEKNINKLFKNVLKDYHLEYKKNVSWKKLNGYLRDLKVTLSTGNYKSFIFMLGTHGGPKTDGSDERTKDGVQMADGKWMSVEEIVRNFYGDEIPAMKDKPKVFIIQSCRGDKMQPSVQSSDNVATVPNQKTKNYPQPAYRPVNSDILIAYATSEGTLSWRHEDKGSWFVTDLCDVITEFYDKENMVNILIRVNGRMVCREEKTKKQERIKQMPCFLCTFTRRFMLKYPTK